MSISHYLFTEEQLELASHFSQLLNGELNMGEVRKVFEGSEEYHLRAWKSLAEQGWLGLITESRYGGAGLSMVDLCLLGLELGKTLAPLPFFSHVCLATQALVVAGSEQIKAAYLPKLADGSLLATLAFREEGIVDWRVPPLVRAEGNRLTGKKVVVAYGGSADIAIVSAANGDRENGGASWLYLVDLNGEGVSKTPGSTIDPASSYASLEFENAPAIPVHEAPLADGVFEGIIYRAAVVYSFIQLGSAQAAFDMGKQYALDRYAFGRQIGSFQAIKHKIARMFEALTIAQANCHFGTWAIRQEPDFLGLAAASALTSACDAFNQCARDNNKIHGGISATWDFDCHLYYRRARLNSLALGNQFLWNKILTENLVAKKDHLEVDFSDDRDESLEQLRAECRKWIRENRPAVEDLYHYTDDERFAVILNWHRKKAAAGWACLHWPKKYGGKEWTPEKIAIWREEEGEALRDLCFPLSIVDIAGAVLMGMGTEEQKERYVRKILSGEEYWCQLFSEPHGGSDVGALRTRAVKDGDEWVVTGQKIWTSNANYSDYGLLIARTDPSVAKHKGLTYFIMDMHAPGVTIRPLKQSTGDAGFCEVFFDNVRIPDANRLGAVGDGWKIVMMTLANEKVALQLFQVYLEKFLDGVAGLEVAGIPVFEHPVVQQKLRDYNNRSWAIKFSELESMHKIRTAGQPGHEESVSKLIVAATNLDIASFVMELYDDHCFDGGSVKSEHLKFFEHIYIHFVGVSMGGGTEEILLNLIGEQFLGLPPEPRVDKNMPFNELPFGI